MKPHDRERQRLIQDLAFAGRQGKVVESKDTNSPFGFMKRLCGWIFFGFVAARILGVFDTRPVHWIDLIGTLILMSVAVWGSGVFRNTALRTGYESVLVNLPVSGETALGWVRDNFFRRFGFAFVAPSLLVAVASHGSPVDHPLQILATSVLLSIVTAATVPILAHPLIGRFRINLVWLLAYALSIILLVYFLYRNDSVFDLGGSPEWLVKIVSSAAWVFPHGWVLPGRFESGGALLAIPWCVWGILLWIRMPQADGPGYDQPDDFISAFGGFGLGEEWDDYDDEEDFGENAPESAGEEVPGAKEPNEIGGSAALQALRQCRGETGGWVDDFVLKFLDRRGRMLAFAMNGGTMNYTSLTNRFLKYSLFWILPLWAFGRFSPDGEWKEDSMIWLGVISLGFAVACLVPISNGLPLLSQWWKMGSQSVPFFSLLSINAREVLRTSFRISLARCILMFPIGGTFMAAAVVSLNLDISILQTVSPTGAATLVWILSRPAFVWYRLQSVANPRKGVRLGHLLYQCLELFCGLIWLLGVGTCAISAFALASWMETGEDIFETFVIFSVGALVVLLGARGAFEIFLFRLRRRKFDWVSQDE